MKKKYKFLTTMLVTRMNGYIQEGEIMEFPECEEVRVWLYNKQIELYVEPVVEVKEEPVEPEVEIPVKEPEKKLKK